MEDVPDAADLPLCLRDPLPHVKLVGSGAVVVVVLDVADAVHRGEGLEDLRGGRVAQGQVAHVH